MKIEMGEENVIISDFSEVEALRIALKIEEDGIKFYSRAEKLSGQEEVKKIYNELRHEEEKHVQTFTRWLAKLIPPEEIDHGDEESFFEFLDTGVFSDWWNMEQKIAAIKDPLAAIRLGIKMEQDSIAFYQALLGKTENEAGKKELAQLIKEEERHLKLLNRYEKVLSQNK